MAMISETPTYDTLLMTTAITSYGKIPVAFNGAVHASRTASWLAGE